MSAITDGAYSIPIFFLYKQIAPTEQGSTGVAKKNIKM